VNALYGPAQLDGHDRLSDDGFPGEPPFTRGIQTTMYRERLWSIRQYAGYGTAGDANQRFRFLLANGQKGLSVGFYTAAALVHELMEARDEKRLLRLQR